MTSLEMIAASQRMGRQVVHMLCEDLTPEEFHHQPVPGANCAAWIVGHLVLSSRRFAERVGATGLPDLTDEFKARFQATRQSAAEQSNLGSKEELLKLFDQIVERGMEVVLQIAPDLLDGPPPTPAPKAVTSFGEMLLFGAMHITMHCGQLSTIRRSLGKSPMV